MTVKDRMPLSHESLGRGEQRAAKKGTLPGDASCSAG
jgi:hypothetical protein